MRMQNRSPFQPRAKLVQHKIENKADEATIYVYDEIGFWGVNAKDFVKDLNANTAKTIHIRFNRPGGAVFDGTTMANAIRGHKSHTIAHVDGVAASIASIVALATDEVVMAENAFLMIHEPWSMVAGYAEDMRKEANLLDKVGGTIVNTYMNKTGKDEAEIKGLMADETWMTAEEALEMGFIDRIDEEAQNEKAKATIFDLSIFANVPDQLKGEQKPPTARELEKILKTSGFSNKQAKEILASGFKDDDSESQRDVEKENKSEDTVMDSGTQRDADDAAQRDVAEPPRKKDRIAELLTRGEILAPSQY